MSITMTIDREGVSPFGKFRWEDAAGIWAREAAPLGRSMLRAQAPFFTGALRESISVREEPSAASYLILFWTQVPYAKYVLGGTRAHTIAAKNAQALRWMANRGHGPAMFAKRVNHPGTKANPFPERAMARIGPAIAEGFARACKEATEL